MEHSDVHGGAATGSSGDRGPTTPIAQRGFQLQCDLMLPLEQRALLDALPFAENHTVVEMTTSEGRIVIELFDDTAPLAVANFLRYVNEDRYVGTVITRPGDGVHYRGGAFTLEDALLRPIDVLEGVIEQAQVTAARYAVAMVRDSIGSAEAASEFLLNTYGDSETNTDSRYAVFGEMRVGYMGILGEWPRLSSRAVDLDEDNDGDGDTTTPVLAEEGANFDDGLQLADFVSIIDIAVIPNPGWSQRAGAGHIVQGYGFEDLDSLYVTRNEFGRPISFQPDVDNLWNVQDMGLQADAPDLTGDIVPFRAYQSVNYWSAVAPSAEGLILFDHQAPAIEWSMRNLTSEIAGAQVITSQVTVFFSVPKTYVVGLADGNGHSDLVYYILEQGQWSFVNIGATDLAEQGQVTPAFVGRLTSYVTAWGGLNVVGVDASGDMHTVWWAPGETLWHADNLSDLTGAPPFVGDLISFAATWGTINLVGTDPQGNVLTTWWSPTEPWRTDNLTELMGIEGPQLTRGSMCSYVTAWGGFNIAGISEEGDLVVYWWTPATQEWMASSITDAIPDAVHPVGKLEATQFTYYFEEEPLSSDFVLAGGIWIFGTATNGDVLRYHWTGQFDAWEMQNVSENAVYDLYAHR